MNEEHQEEFIRLTNEISDTLLALTTYLKRNRVLTDRLIDYNLPLDYLEEWGEFLMDWGEVLQKFGTLNKERDTLLLKMFGLKNDN